MLKRPSRLLLLSCLSLCLLSCGRIIPQQQRPAPSQTLERSTVIAHRDGSAGPFAAGPRSPAKIPLTLG